LCKAYEGETSARGAGEWIRTTDLLITKQAHQNPTEAFLVYKAISAVSWRPIFANLAPASFFHLVQYFETLGKNLQAEIGKSGIF